MSEPTVGEQIARVREIEAHFRKIAALGAGNEWCWTQSDADALAALLGIVERIRKLPKDACNFAGLGDELGCAGCEFINTPHADWCLEPIRAALAADREGQEE